MPPKPQKPPLTHFLAIPLLTPSSRPALESSLLHLQTCIRGQKNEVNEKTHVPLNAVRPVGTLHLTLGVMSLRGEERVREAVEALEGLDLEGLLRGGWGEGEDGEDGEEGEEELGKGGLRDVRGKVARPETEPGKKEDGTQRTTAGAASPNRPRLDSLTRAISPPPSLALSGPSFPAPSSPPSMETQPPSLTPLTLSLSSLRPMHRPAATSVLYAVPTDTTGRLLPFCQRLRTFFTARGFMVPDALALKLHVTVVNTVYARAVAKPSVGGAERKGRNVDGKGNGAGAGAGAGPEKKQKKKQLDKDRELHEDAAANATTAEDEHFGDTAVPGPNIPHQHEHGAPDTDTETAQRQNETPLGRRPTARARTRARPLQLDARPLLARFQNFTWAEDIRVERVAICRMGAVKVRDEGVRVTGEEYVVVGERRFEG